MLISLKVSQNLTKPVRCWNFTSVSAALSLPATRAWHGTVKVSNSHQGLNTVLMAFLKEVFVKFQASFIGLQLIPLRENPAPSNGQPGEDRLAIITGKKKMFDFEEGYFYPAKEAIDMYHRFKEDIALFGEVKPLFLTRDDGQTILTNRHHIYIGQPATIRIV